MDTLLRIVIRVAVTITMLTLILEIPIVQQLITDVIASADVALIEDFIDGCGEFFVTARKLINNFVPAAMLNVILAGSILKKPIEIIVNFFHTTTPGLN